MKHAVTVPVIPIQPTDDDSTQTRPYSPCVPWKSLDVKVLGVIASIFTLFSAKLSGTLCGSDSYLSPSVRRTVAVSERSQPPILPSHLNVLNVLNEQPLLHAAGQTLISMLCPSVASP